VKKLISSRFASALVVLAASASGVFVTGACASAPDSNAQTDVYTYVNSFPQFGGNAVAPGQGLGAGLEGMLEAHCATLDCHGQLGRPLRLYSQNGLRNFDDAGSGGTNVTGGAPTTYNEIFENYIAVIGLQPELMSKVLSGNLDPTQLLIVRKPRQMERHKGGQVIDVGDNADTCLISWLTGVFQPAECNAAATIP
jgi:hypothetical protein